MLKISIYSLLCLTAISATSCKKKTYKAVLTDAVITGMDYRKCMCCGGLMINFTNDSVPYRSDFKLLAESLSFFGLSENAKFPIYLKVKSYVDSNRCNGDFIKIRRFELK